MISHLTPERYPYPPGQITATNKHYGKFQYWPQVYELWFTRKHGDVSLIDFTGECYQLPAHQWEMRDLCGRRQ